MKIPFVGQAYKHDSVNISAQECVNMYPEVQDDGNAKAPAALIGRPGIELLTDFSTISLPPSTFDDRKSRFLYHPNVASDWAVDRNLQVPKYIIYVGTGTYSAYPGKLFPYFIQINIADDWTITYTEISVGNWFYYYADRISRKFYSAGCVADYTSTLITTGGDPIRLDSATSGSSIAFLHGTYGTLNFETLSATHCAFINGFFIVNDCKSRRFYFSNYLTLATWSGADYCTVEGIADKCVALVELKNELWCFGYSAYEVWYHSGSSTVFNPINGSRSNIGMAAPNSLELCGDCICWLGMDASGTPGVYTNNGYAPVKISTIPIDIEIKGYADYREGIGSYLTIPGHRFYKITFEASNVTWCYDLNTGMWHKETWYDTSLNREMSGKCFSVINYGGTQLACSRDDFKLYKILLDKYSDDGNQIIRTRTTPHVEADMKRLYFNSFTMDMEAGVGLNTGQGSDPRCWLSWSDDGGHTWGNPIQRTMGAMGEYNKQISWNRLGHSRNRVFKWQESDPVRVRIIGASIGAETEM